MIKKKLTSILIAGVCAFGAFATAPAMAKDSDDIIVSAPYRVHVERQGPFSREVRVSRLVSTRGLDLRYDRDVEVLHQRIAYNAALACDQAGYIARDSSTSDRECVRSAIRGARPQVRALIYAARA